MTLKLGVFVSHPIQYKAPLHRRLNREEDIEVTVLFGSKKGVEEGGLGFGDEKSWDIPLLEGYNYEFLRNFTPTYNGYFSLVNPTIFTRISREWNALLLHAGYASMSSLLALLASNLKDIPVLLHGAGSERERPQFQKLAKEVYLRAFLRGVNLVLADCSKNMDHYRTFGGEDLDIRLMPAAVDNERFRKARQQLKQIEVNTVREIHDIPEKHKVVLFVGKLIKRKRPNDLLSAFEQINIDATLVFVGDGNRRKVLESYVADRPVENVRFVGFQNQSKLPKYYELGDLLVLPSSYDPSPKVLNEAMNFELPLVVSNSVGSAHDLVQNNGQLFETGDTEEMANAIEWALASEERLKRMGKESYELVEEWSFERDVKVIRDALEDVQ